MLSQSGCCGILAVVFGCAAVGVRAQAPRQTVVGETVAPAALRELVEAVSSYVDDGQIVGAELVVRQHGRTILDESFGWKDRERRVRMEPGTVFNIRSMTKTMVGAVAQMLVDEGRLSLDDPVARFLPGFDRPGARAVTIDHLLTHRAGLPLSVVTSLTEYESLVAMGNAIGQAGPEFEPGSHFRYSDAGANALGAVVEVVEEAPMAEILTRRIVTPLRLGGTFPGSVDGQDRWARVTTMYVRAGREWVPGWAPANGALYPFVWGSQGMFSTPEDYARFVEMIARGGQSGGKRILSRRAVTSMLEPVSRKCAMGSDHPEPTNLTGMEFRYGRMLEVRVPRGDTGGGSEVVVGHSGSDGTIVWAWPERDLVIAYFTQSRGNVTHLRLERVIDHAILGSESTAPPLSAETAEGLLGSYRADFGRFAGSEMRVVIQDGRLALDVPGVYVSELGEPDLAGRRDVVLIPSVSVSFDEGDDGRAGGMRWHEPGQTFVLPRVEESSTRAGAAPIDVREYVGMYRLPEDPTQPGVEVIAVEGTLAMLVPGAPAPLRLRRPDAEGRWVLEANPQVSIRFERDDDGRVASYTAFAPGQTPTVRVRAGHDETASPQR